MVVHPVVGTRVPPFVMEQMEKDIESGEFLNTSEWVRMACVEYARKRQKERVGGGGVLIDLCARANVLINPRADYIMPSDKPFIRKEVGSSDGRRSPGLMVAPYLRNRTYIWIRQ